MEKNIRKIVSEELHKIIGENEEVMEAQISTALSFLQDLQGSANRLEKQIDLVSTSPEVDGHIQESISHINEAIDSYIKTLSPEVRTHVSNRLGEINIDK